MSIKFKQARKRQLLQIAFDSSEDLSLRYKAVRELQTRRDEVLYLREARKSERKVLFGR